MALPWLMRDSTGYVDHSMVMKDIESFVSMEIGHFVTVLRSEKERKSEANIRTKTDNFMHDVQNGRDVGSINEPYN
jgi:hypothetical protein